jgi:hypothetical protein
VISVIVTLPNRGVVEGVDQHIVEIWRLEQPLNPSMTYRVVDGERSAEFTHRFDDGWERCVSRAFKALSRAE